MGSCFKFQLPMLSCSVKGISHTVGGCSPELRDSKIAHAWFTAQELLMVKTFAANSIWPRALTSKGQFKSDCQKGARGVQIVHWPGPEKQFLKHKPAQQQASKPLHPAIDHLSRCTASGSSASTPCSRFAWSQYGREAWIHTVTDLNCRPGRRRVETTRIQSYRSWTPPERHPVSSKRSRIVFHRRCSRAGSWCNYSERIEIPVYGVTHIHAHLLGIDENRVQNFLFFVSWLFVSWPSTSSFSIKLIGRRSCKGSFPRWILQPWKHRGRTCKPIL
jgi:hypothetical protein